MNVISVGVLWTDVVAGREYCRFGKVLKNIAPVKNLDWRKKKNHLRLCKYIVNSHKFRYLEL